MGARTARQWKGPGSQYSWLLGYFGRFPGGFQVSSLGSRAWSDSHGDGWRPAVIRTLFVPRSNRVATTRTASGGPKRVQYVVAALEAGARDLLCEETILTRVVDVFEELAVDLRIDGAQTAVGVDLEDGNARRCLSGRLVPQRCEPSGREQDERKQRGFHHDCQSRRQRVTAADPGASHLRPA